MCIRTICLFILILTVGKEYHNLVVLVFRQNLEVFRPLPQEVLSIQYPLLAEYEKHRFLSRDRNIKMARASENSLESAVC